jgi:hypothetical protein
LEALRGIFLLKTKIATRYSPEDLNILTLLITVPRRKGLAVSAISHETFIYKAFKDDV